MRYRIILKNNITGERLVSTIGFTSRKKAEAFAEEWRSLGKEYGAEVKDMKNLGEK